MVKSELSPHSGSAALRQLNPVHKKGTWTEHKILVLNPANYYQIIGIDIVTNRHIKDSQHHSFPYQAKVL